MKCIRCGKPATIRVYQVDVGSMTGARPGPRVSNIYACRKDAADIARLPWAPPWLAVEAKAAS